MDTIWKRAIQIPFHQSLAAIGAVVSEEKIKVYDGQTEGRRTPSDGKSSHGLWPGELKMYHQNVGTKLYHGGQFYWCLMPLSTLFQLYCGGQFYWCLMPLSTIFQLYCGGQFYWCLMPLSTIFQLYCGGEFYWSLTPLSTLFQLYCSVRNRLTNGHTMIEVIRTKYIIIYE